MKKLLLILTFFSLTSYGQQTLIPDSNFEQSLINLGYDTILDGQVLTSNINTVTSLSLNYNNIADLTGIEDFTMLTTLLCSNNQLTSLDVSNNIALTTLTCVNNQLTNLDVSNNTALITLGCSGNQLTNIDVANNLNLTSINVGNNVSGNNLTSLDVSNNINLEFLGFGYNQITNIDLSNNLLLNELICKDNLLTSLDVSNNPLLTELWCSDNLLTSLDVSNNPLLTELRCDYNQLTSLDVNQNTLLTKLLVSHNPLASLDVSQNTLLEQLSCGGALGAAGNITNIDLSNNIALKILDLRGFDFNSNTSLDLSQNINLEYFSCFQTLITHIDLSHNSALNSVFVGQNQFLNTLNLANGNNINMETAASCGWRCGVSIGGANYQLDCITVDDVAWADTNWTAANGNIVSTMFFSLDCSTAFGCTDSLACNYDSIAVSDDNSCIYPTSSISSATACDSYNWNGNNYTTSGAYNEIFTNSVGCDSVATLDLTINNSSSLTTSLTACGSYHWDGISYSNSGTYTNTYTNVSGCDSLHTLNLTIKEKPSVNIYNNNNNLTIIPSSGLAPYSYLWNTGETNQTITLTSFGTYWAYVTGNNSCSSDTAFYNHSISNIDNFVSDKKLLKIINQLGQNTPFRKNTPLYYLYDDGTVEKKIIIE